MRALRSRIDMLVSMEGGRVKKKWQSKKATAAEQKGIGGKLKQKASAAEQKALAAEQTAKQLTTAAKTTATNVNWKLGKTKETAHKTSC